MTARHLPVTVNGQNIYIEVEEPPSGWRDAKAGDEPLKKVEGAFDKAKRAITVIANDLVGAMKEIDKAIAPSEFQFEFSIKFTAKVGAESTLKITMNYKHEK